MERQLWKRIVDVLKDCSSQFMAHCQYQVDTIVKVWFWGVLHDRPVSWSCVSANWPPWNRLQLPSASTMSRRLRSEPVRRLIHQLEERVCRSAAGDNMVWMIDGKPLVISGCSSDRQAGYGRATGGKAKGYKLHALIGSNGSVAEWRVAPMNVDERKMARRMLLSAKIFGYVLGDGNYDSNPLHKVCDERGDLQFVTPRRYGAGRGFGHRKQTAGRLRSVEILESPFCEFGEGLMLQRLEIERFFSKLSTNSGGLTHLPPWIRTHRRVHRWVKAKLIINALRCTLA